MVLVLFTIVWNTEAWKVIWPDHPPRKPPPRVRLTEPHAAAFAPFQWEADVRVINETHREIKVERVTAVFGKASDHETCDKKGKAARSLYPEVEPGEPRNVYQPLQRGAGAKFRGGPSLDKAFGRAHAKGCPLAVKQLSPTKERLPDTPQDRATFTVVTDDGRTWTSTTTLLYEPRLRVESGFSGGGGGICFLSILPFC
jgi:hypothetical protein